MSDPTTDPSAPQFKIGEVARELGTTVRTLRYYEQEGLLTAPRSAKGTRLYGARHVARFRAALTLTSLGLPLQEVLALTAARPGSPSGSIASRKVLKALQGLRATVLDRLQGFEQLLLEIERAAEVVSTCRHCANLPTDATCPQCLCSRRLDDVPMLALTWSVDD